MGGHTGPPLQYLFLNAERYFLCGGVFMQTLFVLIVFGLDLWGTWDLLKGPSGLMGKILWFLVIVFIPIFGVGAYFLLGRKKP